MLKMTTLLLFAWALTAQQRDCSFPKLLTVPIDFDFVQAVRCRWVEATITATSVPGFGPMMAVSLVRKAIEERRPFAVIVPPGLVLRSPDSYAPDIVMFRLLGTYAYEISGQWYYRPATRASLLDEKPVTYLFFQFTLRRGSVPVEGSRGRYVIDRVEPQLGCILSSRKLITNTERQVALWSFDQPMNLQQANSEGVNEKEWVQIQQVVADCRSDPK